jgi:hypothetical protein
VGSGPVDIYTMAKNKFSPDSRIFSAHERFMVTRHARVYQALRDGSAKNWVLGQFARADEHFDGSPTLDPCVRNPVPNAYRNERLRPHT